MRQAVAVSPDGITRTSLRSRTLTASDIRRVHLFTDENGDTQVVVRGRGWRLVHVTRRELLDPVVSSGLRDLLATIRHQARVDESVDRLLAGQSVAPSADAASATRIAA